MTSIEKAQEARAAQALNKNIRYNGLIMPIADYLQTLKQEGYTPAIGEKPRIQYNRVKYNRMSNHREQEEYERKCNERVTEYRAISPAPATSWVELTKTEYDYFVSLFPPEDETGPEYATEAELNHLFGLNK